MPDMQLPLSTSSLVGVKADMILLRIFVKETLPELARKLNEIGLPFEYYFARYLLSLFSGLFEESVLYRLWDVIFFENAQLA